LSRQRISPSRPHGSPSWQTQFGHSFAGRAFRKLDGTVLCGITPTGHLLNVCSGVHGGKETSVEPNCLPKHLPQALSQYYPTDACPHAVYHLSSSTTARCIITTTTSPAARGPRALVPPLRQSLRQARTGNLHLASPGRLSTKKPDLNNHHEPKICSSIRALNLACSLSLQE
jgi:hypothetical protein